MCTIFGVDSSICFRFRAQTHTQKHRRHWSPYPTHRLCRHSITSPAQSHLGTARCYLNVGECTLPLHVLAVQCATLQNVTEALRNVMGAVLCSRKGNWRQTGHEESMQLNSTPLKEYDSLYYKTTQSNVRIGRVATPHSRKWTRRLRVRAVPCQLQTIPITQPLVRYIHRPQRSATFFLCVTLRCPISRENLPLPCFCGGGTWPLSNAWFLGPPIDHPNAISIISAIIPKYTLVTNRQTDRQNSTGKNRLLKLYLTQRRSLITRKRSESAYIRQVLYLS